MGQLKDLIVTGASRLIGDTFASSLQTNILKIPTSSGGTTYGVGSSGQILKSNGSTIYWAADNNTTYTFTNKGATLAWGTTSTIATVGGVDIKVTMPANPDTNTTYTAGTGLSLSGTKFNHSNSITAGSVGAAASPSHGGTFAIPKITYDAQGHITGATTVNITLPADNNTDTKVTQTAVTASDYTNYRSLVWSSCNSSTKGFSPTSTTDVTYVTNTLYVQPSSGSIYATTFHGALDGNAATATKLATARTIRTNLASTSTASFNGSANITPGVTGTLGTGNGGTGNTAFTANRVIFSESASKLSSSGHYASSTLLGVNQTTAPSTNLYVNGTVGVSSGSYGDELPETGTTGQIFFQTSDDYYEIPAGGSVGQVLVKNSINDRDVAWSNNIIGNAATATALATSAGSSTLPVYFSSGKPVACSTTLGVSITGNSATATKLATARTISLTGSVTGSGSFDGSGNLSIATTTNHSHSYLPLSGGTMTGSIINNSNGGAWISGRDRAIIKSTTCSEAAGSSWHAIVSTKTTNGSFEMGCLSGENSLRFVYCTDSNYSSGNNTGLTCGYFSSSGVFYGAAWNDYAEYRETKEEIKPGYCVIENGDDTLSLSQYRMQPGAEIVSDTFGFAIGETDECKTPIAATGRVLVYTYEDREIYRQHIGEPVCSGPNGTVSLMTDEEYAVKGYCAIGFVSAVPDYEEWGAGKVKVNGRVWIRVR